jgi:hypothetical protein
MTATISLTDSRWAFYREWPPQHCPRNAFGAGNGDAALCWLFEQESVGAQHADAVIGTVADVEGAAVVDEDAVRPVQPAAKRIAVRPVAALAVSDDRGDRAVADRANHVILGVRQVDRAAGTGTAGADGNPFGPV